MRALIARDLADAGIAGLSADRRFATAYNAALQAANMAIACAGYRIMSKVGHHRVSLESTKLVLGKPTHKYADYFETCRRKRNTIDYTFSNVATETEAKEILIQASEFYSEVEDYENSPFAEEVGRSRNAHCLDWRIRTHGSCVLIIKDAQPSELCRHAAPARVRWSARRQKYDTSGSATEASGSSSSIRYSSMCCGGYIVARILIPSERVI